MESEKQFVKSKHKTDTLGKYFFYLGYLYALKSINNAHNYE